PIEPMAVDEMASAYRQAYPDPRLEPLAKDPRRVELIIAVAFVMSTIAFIILGVTYWRGGQPQVEGVCLLVGLGALGFGMTAWGKYLMPRGPFMEEREVLPTSEEDKQIFAKTFSRGAVAVERRGFLGKLMGLALGAFSLLALFPLKSLGPKPGKILYNTTWRANARLVTAQGKPVNVADIEVGGLVTVFPENDPGGALSQTVLIRVGNSDIVTKPGRETWAPQGYVAYSKVCTHAGCPVGLYEHQLQELLCPCHQSLFKVLEGAQPVFGPAPRPLPQLPLKINAEGYLVAQSDYHEAVGPGFWERA
ncbi:MAG: Rieske 2Fe-2S domain-containing protein, partial [Acidimicrobiales bacterium]